MASISQNGFSCAGPDPLIIVREAVARDPEALSSLGLDQFRQGLENNPAASALASNQLPSTDLLVGWHASFRACGALTYPTDTYYFFIREQAGFRVRFPVSADSSDEIIIPSDKLALLLVSPTGQTCVLVNPWSVPGSHVTLVQDSPSGRSSPMPLTPSQDVPKTPSPSSSPRSVVPSPSPPTVQIPPPNVSDLPQSPAPSSITMSPGAQVSVSASPFLTSSVAPETPSNFLSSPTDSMAPSEDSPLPTILNPTIPSSPAPVDSDDVAGGEGAASSEPTDPDGNAVCFPASALVSLPSGKVIPMNALQVGDVVLTPDGPSPVIFFTHRLSNISYPFVRIATLNGSIVLTSGHYVPLWQGGLRRAADVTRGDWLMYGGDSVPVEVVDVETVRGKGLYNPQTKAGMIIVDGFVATTYTTAIDPVIAHGALLAPIRALFKVSLRLTSIVSGLFSSGAPYLTALLPPGQPVVSIQTQRPHR